MHHCCCSHEFAHAWHGWGHGYGPPPWMGWECCHCCGRHHHEPTKAERKEALEALKKHLEKRLADINDELSKL